MKVGLYNLEPIIVNTAMMQVSTYHKNKGDEVEIYNPLFKSSYDKIYAFSIFDYTDKGYVTKEMHYGGSGFNIKDKLPKEIMDCNYDWSLFPDCDYSIIWFSRGCIRNCPFCIVQEKEGMIHSVDPKNLNPNGNHIKINDNNFFANPKWREAITHLINLGQYVDFQCGIDIRIFSQEQGEALSKLKIKHHNIKIAWDNPRDIIIPKLKKLLKYVKAYKIMCFVLIGYWSTQEEDLYRVEELRKLGVDPFVMPYNKKDPYQNKFARWVNHKAIWKTVKWEEYE